jgi:hypothetical protein
MSGPTCVNCPCKWHCLCGQDLQWERQKRDIRRVKTDRLWLGKDLRKWIIFTNRTTIMLWFLNLHSVPCRYCLSNFINYYLSSKICYLCTSAKILCCCNKITIWGLVAKRGQTTFNPSRAEAILYVQAMRIAPSQPAKQQMSLQTAITSKQIKVVFASFVLKILHIRHLHRTSV